MNILASLIYKEVRRLPDAQVAQYAWEHCNELYANIEEADGSSRYYTTPILRTYCGCNLTYFDEMTQSWMKLDAHDDNCLREKYPIEEDMEESTIKRRRQREVHVTDLTFLEERIHSA